jgi:hypothetical protein
MSAVRTTCPFCLCGCESVVTAGHQYRMEYPADARVNRGRLCPRGNSASLVVDHPKRLAYPLLDGREVSWDRAMSYCRDALSVSKPEELAIVYSRGLTEAEVRLVRGFARSQGTGNLVCGYIEPGNCFVRRLKGVKAATLNDVRAAKTMLLVGDAFSTSPVAAGPMVEARYKDRKNRLIVIDCIKTRQAGFAHLFLEVKPGTEPFALVGIAALLDRALAGVDVARLASLSGIEQQQLEQAAAMLGNGPGFVGSSTSLGRNAYPVLHSLASQLVALKAGMPFTGFTEARVPEGEMSFGQLRQAAGEERVKSLFWFGGMYPYSYPELFPEATKLEHRVATSIFRPERAIPGLVLPVPSELEKESVGHSYWGEVNRHAVAAPCSGSRTVGRILGELASVAETPEKPLPAAGVEEALKMAAGAAATHVPGPGPVLVGEKKAIGIGGLYEAEADVCVNPTAAQGLGVVKGSCVVLTTQTGTGEFLVHLTDAVPAGVLSIGVNRHGNRALFPLEFDAAGTAAMPPVRAEIRRSATVPRPAPETRAIA